MTYAMVLKNRVIGVLHNQETAPFWPPDNKGNQVVAKECDASVEVGMIYIAETGMFTKREHNSRTSQLDRIENALNLLAADSVTVANVETAILEGVSEV